MGMVQWIFHRSCWTAGDYCYLQDLFVDESVRGSGVGRGLIEHVYAQARRRGMDFVTITDHDTVEGVLSVTHLPGVLTGEEVTCWFPEDQCKMHVLVYGIGRDVDTAVIDRLLGAIERRCTAHRNGAEWQAETFHRIDEQRQPLDRRDALREMLRRYIEHMHANEPVADWPIG